MSEAAPPARPSGDLLAGDHGTAAAPRSRARASALRPAAWPWWVQVLAVYAAARLVSAAILVIVSHSQAASDWTGAAPSYSEYVGRMWDAAWYHRIAESGYPADLPVRADGSVRQNSWAFFPLFPLTVRALGVTGLGWDVLAPGLSLVCGAGAVLVVHRLVATAGAAAVERRPGLPLATVVMVSVFPSAPVLQVAYTESLALLLVAGALLLLARRRYAGVAVLVVLLGVTRAVALPMAAVVLWHLVARWRAGPVPVRDRVRIGVLAAVCVGSGLLWPAVCGVATGVPDAYLRTQAAWRGTGETTPFVPWVDISRWLFDGAGPWLLALVVAAVAALAINPVAARLGPEMQGWTVAYLGYLLAVLEPGTSLVRFLILAFPLGAVAVGWTRSRAWFWTLVALGVAGQCWWVWSLWRLVPPSGWPP